jgi:F5/8 type C domain-containing protein
VLAAGVYVLLTLAYTWPLPIKLTTGIAHDLYDPILNAWILWWTTTAVPLTAHWWNAPFFYPAAGTLAFSEHLLGLAPIAAPLIALTGNPLVGYNVALLATFPLSGLAAYFLAFTVTRRHDAAFVSGLAYAFAPYRLGQVPHIQVLTVYWTPISLAALHRYGRDRRAMWAILAAAAWLMQALSSGYYMFFLAVLIALWLLWFAVGRWTLRMFVTAGAAFASAVLLMVPLLSGYQSILGETYGFTRSLGEIRSFSADVAGLLLASEDLLAWGWVHVVQRPESGLFPGLTVVLLAAFALYDARPFARADGDSARLGRIRLVLSVVLAMLLVATALPVVYGAWRLTIGGVRLLSIARADKPLTLALATALLLMLSWPRVRAALHRRSVLAFYLLAAAAMWVFALGPDPTIFDRRFIYQAPYGQLMRLPGFDGLRVPARFWTMALACLSVVAALAVNRLPAASRRTFVAIATAGLLIDGWPRTFIVLPAPSLRPSPVGVSSRLDLPMSDEVDTQALYQQMFDRVPLHNGYSGYIAPHYYALRTLTEDRDPRILQELARTGPLAIVVDHAGDADGAIRKFVLAYPGATLDHNERDWSSYRLPRSTLPPAVPDRHGMPLRILSLSTFPSPPHASRALDGDLTTRWSGGMQQQSAEATVELETAAHVGQVVIDLGGFVTDFPKRLRIEVSADGTTWETVWTGDTALHAYYAAIRHPREMPLVFALNRDGVRFVRLQQIGFGKHDWSIPELHVLR